MKAGLLERSSDIFLEIALGNAMLSPCGKMGFGAVLVNDYNGVIFHVANNNPSPETAWICEPDCIRLSIPSRTNSMIGACYHAEELAMAQGLEAGLDLRNFVLFVAGVRDGEPALRPNPVFSCIRCASMMVLHKLKGVYLHDGTYWHYQTAEHAHQTAFAYANEQRSL